MKRTSGALCLFAAFFLFSFLVVSPRPASGQTTGSAAEVPAGTSIHAELHKDLNPKTAKVSDVVELDVVSDVRGPSNAVLIPKKARLLGKVVAIEPASEKDPSLRILIEVERAEWKGGAVPLHARFTSVRIERRQVVTHGGEVTFGEMPPEAKNQQALSGSVASDGRLVFESDKASVLPVGTAFTLEQRGSGAAAAAGSFEAFREAAQKGNAEAQFQLGLMYHQGKGAPQDFAAAAEWYRKAAEQGIARAQNNLAVLYAQGQGVPQDLVEAHIWFAIAGVAKPDKNKANLQLLEARMTPEQIADANRRAAEWMKQHPASH